jgi:hypothetical protein
MPFFLDTDLYLWVDVFFLFVLILDSLRTEYGAW